MFMKKYQLLNTFQWLLMTLFFLFFIMGCDDDEKVREEEEKITIGEDQLAIELDAEDTSASIKFTALASWTATIKEAEVHNWVALSSKQGIGGLVTLNLILKKNKIGRAHV